MCPATVDTGKCGISLYGISIVSVNSAQRLPSPDPSTTAVFGRMAVCAFMYSALICAFSKRSSILKMLLVYVFRGMCRILFFRRVSGHIVINARLSDIFQIEIRHITAADDCIVIYAYAAYLFALACL